MKKYTIVITEPAEADLRGIAQYISFELKEPPAAQNLINKIGEAIFVLEKMPYRYPVVNDEQLAFQGIRMLLVENYIVFYFVSEMDDSVTVIRILYGKREWNRVL
ncbi:type II toxin-antitoxin system RelE/ParE family toxin [Brevibacillus sp. B_LB10_24]|uniref:type II toxin-antitoxin system RelE/ParE family toxin n=1 Tax=Brevibacillus sp. B_LB10_24 TaxID=3380645 RepID=UPI0038BA4A31